MKNPIQPITTDANGVKRFKQNKIVRDLLDFATARGFGLNEIAARIEYSDDDMQQLAQLIGYSVDGYGELDYVDDDAFNAATAIEEGKSEDQARIDTLQDELNAVRSALKEPMARLLGCHPDDFRNC